MHGSHENRFEVVYAAGHLSREEIESVNYSAGDLEQLLKKYDIRSLSDGWHLDSEEKNSISSKIQLLGFGRLKLIGLRILHEGIQPVL